jgi:hypothetical protein
MVDAGNVGELRDVPLTEKQNVAFQYLTFVPRICLRTSFLVSKSGL